LGEPSRTDIGALDKFLGHFGISVVGDTVMSNVKRVVKHKVR
jgi:hypothetical protein